MTCGRSAAQTLTIHSWPAPSAVEVRFAEPMYAVVSPLFRRNSHAFAWSRVRRVSYDTRTCAPGRRAKVSSAATSVVPVKVVVRRRSFGEARRAKSWSASWIARTPPTVTNAMIASTSSAVAISRANSWPRVGSSRLRVSKVEVASGDVGRSGTAPR